MVLPRILKRDIRILVLIETTELSPKEIAKKLGLTSIQFVYEAQRRQKKYKKFYVEQIYKSLQNVTTN